ncbi:kinase-like domain-containing protein [Sordaria brevicollis]|uniref:Kinase-like domain-containing protein n=1 Tax=Sordaria brevicollis TaxID=83679 RepID=A0AAE0PJ87_SORBR|nr:kinase-like domain-containing protein [Sordaria brevicollis]
MCLGRGPFERVWKEELLDVPTCRRVRCVKQIRKEEHNFIQSSRRELYALTTFSWDTDHGDLQQYIDRGVKFGDREASLITRQIASALKYMHAKLFVHRDLQPSNILVAAEGPVWSVKLADFGVATSIHDPELSSDYIRTSGYMAPELVDSKDAYTTAVDVWAMGAVAFCLLVGASPFYKLDDMLEYCAGIGPFPTRELGASSGFSIDFILRAMDPVPHQRLSVQQALTHDWFQDVNFDSVLDPGYVRVHFSLTNPSGYQSKSLMQIFCPNVIAQVKLSLANVDIVSPTEGCTKARQATLSSSGCSRYGGSCHGTTYMHDMSQGGCKPQ